MCKVIKKTVYEVDGLPGEVFTTEADAATASILVMLGLQADSWWDIAEENLHKNAEEIRKQLNILLEPRNVKP